MSTYLLEKTKEITQKDRDLTERVYNYFATLRERYVTEIRYKERIKKKFCGLVPYYADDFFYKYEYRSLLINVKSFGFEQVQVIITNKILPLQGDIIVSAEFPQMLFEHNDYYISHSEQIQKFLKEFLCTAIPKYLKYSTFVDHIEDEEKKYYVSNKLEKLFESDEYRKIKKDLADSNKINEYITNLIKGWERE